MVHIQAVKRNIERFPNDFMFQLTLNEVENLRSQIVTSSLKHGGRRYQALVFTENGVAMLSGILNSPIAVQVNISIMRTFTKLRSIILMEGSLETRLEKLEVGTNKLFKVVFERLDSLEENISAIKTDRKKIGFKRE